MKKLKYVTVYYSSGHKITTSMNPNLTDREVRNYFRVGKVFNIGKGQRDRMTKVIKVKIYR